MLSTIDSFPPMCTWVVNTSERHHWKSSVENWISRAWVLSRLGLPYSLYSCYPPVCHHELPWPLYSSFVIFLARIFFPYIMVPWVLPSRPQERSQRPSVPTSSKVVPSFPSSPQSAAALSLLGGREILVCLFSFWCFLVFLLKHWLPVSAWPFPLVSVPSSYKHHQS